MSQRLPDIDVAVVGAGVVGLATAASLARAGRSVLVLERHDRIAQETTTRNSEVLHAGIYYPSDSLKARLCIAGRRTLYERCRALGIGHRRLGKLIVAVEDAELETLEQLHQQGVANGVEELQLIDAAHTRRLEPQLRAAGGLLSPASGIVDGHALCLSYQAEAESHGAVVALSHDVEAIELRAELWQLTARTPDGARQSLVCSAVVNAAGLAGDRIAALAGLDVEACGYGLELCKGDYFSCRPGAPLRLSRLVYPVPAGPGLGVHATLDLAGRIRFGPDAEYVARPRYDVDPEKRHGFAAAVQRYLPCVEADWLAPDYAGVRPKLSGPGQPFRDFVVREESERGLPGLVSCIGIESPGLTASPAIGERVAALLASL